MAKKGTYSAFQTQPQVPSGQFAGAGSFSRMAQVQAQQRAEERAEQRQLKAEYRQAISNAIEAGNIDYTNINKNVHSMVGSVLDWYGEKTADFMETMDEDYSFERQMEMAQLKTEFQSKIGTITGLGQAIEQYAKGDWDNIMSIKSQNQLTSFVRDIPNMTEGFDPDTLAVNGKRIDQLFRDQVDTAGFVEQINEDEVLDAIVEDVFETGTSKESTIRQGDRELVIKEERFDPSKAKSIFLRNMRGTLELEKLKRSLLLTHEQIDDESEREDFEANYMSIGSDGEAYVTEDGAFNYFMDEKVEPRRKSVIEEKPYDGNKLTTKQRQDAFDELMSNQNLLRNINEATTDNMTGIVGHEIKVDGLNAQVTEGRITYNPFTGENATAISHVVDDEGNLRYFTRFYENSLNGRQELMSHVYGKDYRAIKEETEMKTGQSFDPPETTLSFEDRQEGIDMVNNGYQHSYETVFATRQTEPDLRDAAERAWGIVTETHPETGTVNEPLINFMADYLGVNKKNALFGTQFGFDKPIAEGYGLSKYGVSGLNKTLDLKDSDDEYKQDQASKLAKLTSMARALKADGVADEDIARRLVNAANQYEKDGDINFEFDRVKREIGNDVEKMNAAKRMLQAGFNDSEILNIVSDKSDMNTAVSQLEQGASKQDVLSSLIDSNEKIKWAEANAPVSAGQEMDWEAAAESMGYPSVKAAKIAYYNSKKQ